MDTPPPSPSESNTEEPKPLPKKKSRGCGIAALVLAVLVGTAFFWPRDVILDAGSLSLWDPRAIRSLEIAIKGYQTEYNKYPSLTVPWEEGNFRSTEGQLLKCLLGKDPESNPRLIRFSDPPSTKAQKGGLYLDAAGDPHLVDRYGNPYRVFVDADSDGLVPNPDPDSKPDARQITGGVLIYSAGKDGDYATWKDNVKNW